MHTGITLVLLLVCTFHVHALTDDQSFLSEARLSLPWAEFLDATQSPHTSDLSLTTDLSHAAHTAIHAASRHGPHVAVSIAHHDSGRTDEAVMLYTRARAPHYALKATWHAKLPHVAPLPPQLHRQHPRFDLNNLNNINNRDDLASLHADQAIVSHLRSGFGRSLALDPGYLAVGSPHTRNAGAVDLYSLFADLDLPVRDPFALDPFRQSAFNDDIESAVRPMHRAALFCPYRSRFINSDQPLFGDAVALHDGMVAVSAPGFEWDARSQKGVVFFYKMQSQDNDLAWVLSGHARPDPFLSILQMVQQFEDIVGKEQPQHLQQQLQIQLSSPLQSGNQQESISCRLEDHVIVCTSHVDGADVGKDIPAQIVQDDTQANSLPSQHPVHMVSTKGMVLAAVCITGMFLGLCMSSRRFFRPKNKATISPFTPTGDFGSMVEFQDVVSINTFSPVVALPPLSTQPNSQSAKKAARDANKYASSPQDA
eukprot:TRINITY_DN3583_c0_g1_i1.p1 TRINITY_DN3583_c0_g1~~TRINITY_DN3583_c0_g1_i1.p1  ORF type:complete len:482 (-),score=112.25 TRINITY_DN3583_c0_g1_i1:1028-2473(-)